jgi:hypothetical protein
MGPTSKCIRFAPACTGRSATVELVDGMSVVIGAVAGAEFDAELTAEPADEEFD